MQDHFSLNGFRPDDHELVEAAVNDVGDAVWLTVEGESQQSKPEHWYGQTVVSSRTAIMRKVRGIHPRMAPARNTKRVNAVSLNAVLSRCDQLILPIWTFKARAGDPGLDSRPLNTNSATPHRYASRY